MSDTRSQLLEAAHELFLAQGYANTTIQQLADRVGISKGAVYLSFRSKSDVMTALLHDLDDSVLSAIRAIAGREDLSPREKFREQLRFQFADVREKSMLFEVYLKDAGVAIDEELTLLSQKMRTDWQRAQEDFVRLAFPEHDPRFTTDLAIVINGVLNDYYSYVVLEAVEIDPDAVADFILVLVEAIVERLGRGDVEPVLSADQLLGREELERQIQDAKERRIDRALDEISAHGEGLNDADATEIQETVDAIRHALAQESSPRVVLQGLVANLREHKQLSAARKALAYELGLKLI